MQVRSTERRKKCVTDFILLLETTDIVYAIVYSMLLLNTDLHIVHGSSHHRMSRSEFCENTMSTLMNNILAISEQRVTSSTWKHDMESYLKETYSSVKSKGILQPHSIDTPMRSSHKESSGVATATKSILQRMGSLKQPSTTSSPSPLPHRRKQHVSCGRTNGSNSSPFFFEYRLILVVQRRLHRRTIHMQNRILVLGWKAGCGTRQNPMILFVDEQQNPLPLPPPLLLLLLLIPRHHLAGMKPGSHCTIILATCDWKSYNPHPHV